MPGIERDAIHRAHFDALRLVEMTDAFGAAPEVDHVDLRAHGDRVVRALGLAHVAVDALVGDLQRHQDFPPRPIFSFMRLAVVGWTNSEMSPPSTAISRTIVADRNRYLSERREEQRLDARRELAVHAGELELVLEVRDRPQAAQDHLAGILLHELRQQPAEARHLHVLVRLQHFLGELHALVEREERPLRLAVGDAHDHLVEELRCPLDEVLVPVGDRVEGARIDGADGHGVIS
jgi:hypothetical protein